MRMVKILSSRGFLLFKKMQRTKNIQKKIIISALIIVLIGILIVVVKEGRHSRESGNLVSDNTIILGENRLFRKYGNSESASTTSSQTLQNIPSHSQIYKYQETIATSTKENNSTFTLSMGDKRQIFSFTKGITLYDAFKELQSKGEISFEGKNYPGLGFFVTRIGDLKSGDGKNLMYDINGKEASVGVSAYVLKEGDIIEWKLK